MLMIQIFLFIISVISYDIKSLPLLFENDKIKAYKIHDHLWMFWIKSSTNSIFIIEGSEKSLVIDCGVKVSGLSSMISKVTSKPQVLALTHGHRDHSASISQFSKVYMNIKDKMMLLPYDGNITYVDDGDIIDIGDKQFQVIAMYGHTEGSIGFLDIQDKWLFTGDAIGSTSLWMQITPLPLETALDVIWRIDDIEDYFQEIFVGHYPELDHIANMTYVNKMRYLIEKVLYTKDYPNEPFGGGFFSSAVVSKFEDVELVYNQDNLYYK